MADTEILIDGLFFGEAPRWHEGRLWYSDFYDQTVFSVDMAGNRQKEAFVENRPSGIGWLPNGEMLIVSMLDRLVMKMGLDGTIVLHASLEPYATFHANDMVVDQTGRAYVGNFGFDLTGMLEGKGSPCTTCLIKVDLDGSICIAADNLQFPNGTVIFPDGKTLVVAESFGGVLTAFSIDSEGNLSDRRIWAKLEGCAPDGICLDAEGAIWVANAGGKECRRVAEGGEVLQSIATTEFCYACMLGGEDGKTLFMMTAESSEERIASASRKGKIEMAEVSVAAAGRP